MRYIPFVGDGHSKSYSSMLKSQPYDPAVYIPKEDCIGHVTKWIGTALRKLTTTYKGNFFLTCLRVVTCARVPGTAYM